MSLRASRVESNLRGLITVDVLCCSFLVLQAMGASPRLQSPKIRCPLGQSLEKRKPVVWSVSQAGCAGKITRAGIPLARNDSTLIATCSCPVPGPYRARRMHRRPSAEDWRLEAGLTGSGVRVPGVWTMMQLPHQKQRKSTMPLSRGRAMQRWHSSHHLGAASSPSCGCPNISKGVAECRTRRQGVCYEDDHSSSFGSRMSSPLGGCHSISSLGGA